LGIIKKGPGQEVGRISEEMVAEWAAVEEEEEETGPSLATPNTTQQHHTEQIGPKNIIPIVRYHSTHYDTL